jgi:hypothetical protein
MARPSNTSDVAEAVFNDVVQRGVLLQTGGEFPSVTTIICGEPLSGSWWSHPQANLIHWVLEELNDHPELTTAKLINGKVTIVHSAPWPTLVSVGSAREPWQMTRLSQLAKTVLDEVDRAPFRLDQFSFQLEGRPANAVRALERRLLVHTEEVHTESGKHSKLISNWKDWWMSSALGSASPKDAEEAKATLEKAVEGFEVKLPW